MTNRRNARLIRLLSAMRSRALHLHLQYRRDIAPDDITAEAARAFLEQCEQDLQWLSNPDSVLITYAIRTAWNSLRRLYHFDSCNVPLQEWDASPLQTEATAFRNIIAQEVWQIIARLPVTYKAVVAGIMDGLPKQKIMATIGAPPQSYAWYRKSLAYAFQRMNPQTERRH